MKKNTMILLIFTLLLTPVTSFADNSTTGTGIGGIQTTLPVYELPELDPLEMPSLSKNYENMAKQMKRMGFGDYRYKNSLPLPDVEAPTGTGTNAYDTFVATYGDLWSDPSRQLNKESTLPVDEVLNAASSFSLKAQTSFDTIKSKDSAAIATLLAKKLDTSKNWDLSSIKSSLPKMSSNAMSTYLAGAGTNKPSSWGSKSTAPSTETQMKNLSGLAAAMGQSSETMIANNKVAIPQFARIVGAIGGSFHTLATVPSSIVGGAVNAASSISSNKMMTSLMRRFKTIIKIGQNNICLVRSR